MSAHRMPKEGKAVCHICDAAEATHGGDPWNRERCEPCWRVTTRWRERHGDAMFAIYIVTGILGFAVLMGVLAPGCAPSRIVLPEPLGGAVVKALEDATGTHVDAVTIPGLPPVYPAPPSPCVEAHEAIHQRDQEAMGAGAWTRAYLVELRACWEREAPRTAEERRVALGVCYQGHGMEAEAFRVQRDCEAGR